MKLLIAICLHYVCNMIMFMYSVLICILLI
nr:MAG TPA: hypothetical protein [Caudoviricetes sp.]DAT09913.1 MAG TPA: hypothetical protein [Caudoviricetes sp.]